LNESVFRKSSNVISAKADIRIGELTSWIALKGFISCSAFAGMTAICRDNGLT
jgi:hypothetical protein